MRALVTPQTQLLNLYKVFHVLAQRYAELVLRDGNESKQKLIRLSSLVCLGAFEGLTLGDHNNP